MMGCRDLGWDVTYKHHTESVFGKRKLASLVFVKAHIDRRKDATVGYSFTFGVKEIYGHKYTLT